MLSLAIDVVPLFTAFALNPFFAVRQCIVSIVEVYLFAVIAILVSVVCFRAWLTKPVELALAVLSPGPEIGLIPVAHVSANSIGTNSLPLFGN